MKACEKPIIKKRVITRARKSFGLTRAMAKKKPPQTLCNIFNKCKDRQNLSFPPMRMKVIGTTVIMGPPGIITPMDFYHIFTRKVKKVSELRKIAMKMKIKEVKKLKPLELRAAIIQWLTFSRLPEPIQFDLKEIRGRDRKKTVIKFNKAVRENKDPNAAIKGPSPIEKYPSTHRFTIRGRTNLTKSQAKQVLEENVTIKRIKVTKNNNVIGTIVSEQEYMVHTSKS